VRPAFLTLTLASLGLALVCGCGGGSPAPDAAGAAPAPLVLRVGHFPNVTHAQGLVAHDMSREGAGWFEERLGGGARIEWYVYNAGPSAMEALLAGSLDLTYVGPNPALNAHVKSGGEEIHVVAGAARGGGALVVQGDGRVAGPEDLRGRRVATPQLGNTQDVSCRAWLTGAGLRVTQTGGDVFVVPTPNPDQLALFQKRVLDAVWTVEPWVSRLEMEAGGRVLLTETGSLTTILVASARFLRERPDVAKRFAAAHAELTQWVAGHGDEAKRRVRAELLAETTREMPQELLARCWPRIEFATRIGLADFQDFLRTAQEAGFLADAGDVSRLVEVPQ
jgi:NitT/TauT family transport system substrate-binding protein